MQEAKLRWNDRLYTNGTYAEENGGPSTAQVVGLTLAVQAVVLVAVAFEYAKQGAAAAHSLPA